MYQDFNLVYKSTNNQSIIGYSGSDYASNVEDRKSTSDYVFKHNDCLISWNSNKQKTVSLL